MDKQKLRGIILENNRINWICLGKECPTNCCSPTSNVLHGSKPITWEPIKREITENTVPAFGSEELPKEGLCDFGDGAIHIKQSDKEGCFFLAPEGGCSQYLRRSCSCMTYPFFIDKYQGVCVDISCPGVGAGWTRLDELVPVFEKLRELYVHQIEVAISFLKRNSKNNKATKVA